MRECRVTRGAPFRKLHCARAYRALRRGWWLRRAATSMCATYRLDRFAFSSVNPKLSPIYSLRSTVHTEPSPAPSSISAHHPIFPFNCPRIAVLATKSTTTFQDQRCRSETHRTRCTRRRTRRSTCWLPPTAGLRPGAPLTSPLAT